jgi:hypothetical protein
MITSKRSLRTAAALVDTAVSPAARCAADRTTAAAVPVTLDQADPATEAAHVTIAPGAMAAGAPLEPAGLDQAADPATEAAHVTIARPGTAGAPLEPAGLDQAADTATEAAHVTIAPGATAAGAPVALDRADTAAEAAHVTIVRPGTAGAPLEPAALDHVAMRRAVVAVVMTLVAAARTLTGRAAPRAGAASIGPRGFHVRGRAS